jgi:hypothetical protein
MVNDLMQASSALDQEHARQFRELLNASNISAQTISCYGGSEDVKMRWGEAVPMWYLQKYVKTGKIRVYASVHIFLDANFRSFVYVTAPSSEQQVFK